MKSYILFTVAILILAGRTSGYSQFVQDPGDSLAADTVQLQFMALPDSASGSLGVQADLWMFSDGNTINGMSVGFQWENQNMIMDSAVVSPEADAAFDFMKVLFDGSNIRVSNDTYRFLFAGANLFSGGLAPAPERRLIASYYFTMSQWTTADSTAIDSAVWSGGSDLRLVYENSMSYVPFLISDIVGYDFSETCCTGPTGNIDMDPADIVDIADLTLLNDHLFISLAPLPCPAEANVDGDPAGNVDIADLTFLIDHLFINFPPTADCQ